MENLLSTTGESVRYNGGHCKFIGACVLNCITLHYSTDTKYQSVVSDQTEADPNYPTLVCMRETNPVPTTNPCIEFFFSKKTKVCFAWNSCNYYPTPSSHTYILMLMRTV